MKNLKLKIQSKTLTLRPYDVNDHDEWKAAYLGKLPKQNRFDSGPPPLKKVSKPNFLEVVSRHKKLRDTDKCYILGAFDRSTGTLIGAVDLFILARLEFQWAALGYQIFNQHWNKGFGTEAIRLALHFAFTRLRLNRVEAAINLDNPASVKVAKRAGMRKECVRKKFYYEYGGWVDHLIYAAVPEDIGLRANKPKIER